MIWYKNQIVLWGCSSVGRARRSQCRGQGFEPPHLHLFISKFFYTKFFYELKPKSKGKLKRLKIFQSAVSRSSLRLNLTTLCALCKLWMIPNRYWNLKDCCQTISGPISGILDLQVVNFLIGQTTPLSAYWNMDNGKMSDFWGKSLGMKLLEKLLNQVAGFPRAQQTSGQFY